VIFKIVHAVNCKSNYKFTHLHHFKKCLWNSVANTTAAF